MTNYPQELAQDAVCQSHTGHMTGLWFLPARPLRLNTNERMNEVKNEIYMALEYFSWRRETVKHLFLTEILSIITYERN